MGRARGGLERLLAALLAHRTPAVALALALALAGAAMATRLVVRNDLAVWFVDDDPALVAYQRFVEEFGGDEVVLLAWEGSEPVASAARLGELARVGNALLDVDGVARVVHLGALPVAEREGGAVALRRVVEGAVASDDEARARAALSTTKNPERLVGRDGRTAVVYAWLAPGADLDARRGAILEGMRAAVVGVLGERARDVAWAGGGVVYQALNDATLRDGAVFISLAYLVVVVALYWVTRRLLYTALAVAAVTCADWLVFGAMASLGVPLNAVTASMPTVVIVVGVAYLVHLASHLDSVPAEAGADRSRLARAMAVIVVPTAFNALTTAAGFASLSTASMRVTREYGLFAALGILLVFLYAVVLTTWAAPRALAGAAKAPPRAHAAATLALAAARLGVSRPRLVVAAFAAAALVAAAASSRIVVDTYTIGFLPEGHEVRRGDRFLAERVGPYVPLEIVVRTTEAGGWRTAAVVAGVERLAARLAGDEGFGASLSAVDVLREAHRALGANTPWPPTSDDEVRQLWALLTLLGDGHEREGLLSEDERALRFTVQVPMASAARMEALARRAATVAREALAGAAAVEVTGYLPLYAREVREIVADQARSFAFAFALVFALVGALLRSWRLLFVAVWPNLLPPLCVLGLMGAAGIRLDVATVIVAAALLGIVVDDTVHVLYRLRGELARGATLEGAVLEAARSAGRAVTSTSVILCAGFLVMACSTIGTVRYVGVLSAAGVVAALAADLLLVPALCTLCLRETTTS